MKITLVGFMGSGKTTVARLLSSRLQLPLIEMDDEIRARFDGASIAEIFERHGEEAFRDAERRVAEDLLRTEQAVISSGGGAISNPSNVASFKANGGILVYLRAEFETLRQRIRDQGGRPLFRDVERARALYEERLAIYGAAADLIIDTDDKGPGEVVSEIIRKMEPHSK